MIQLDLFPKEKEMKDAYIIPGSTKQHNSSSSLEKQVAGNHYKDMKIQPIEFIHMNNIGFLEGNAIKYLCRWRNKNGIQDLEKAKHYIEMLIEMESWDARETDRG